MHTYDELQPYDSEPIWDPGGNPFHFLKEKKGVCCSVTLLSITDETLDTCPFPSTHCTDAYLKKKKKKKAGPHFHRKPNVL